MTGAFSFVLDFIVDNYGIDNIFWIMYVINFILSAVAYELGFAKKLPVWQNIIIYLLLLIGNFITTLFSILKMPMTESLVLIVIVLAIYRSRMHFQRKRNNAS